MFFLRVLHLFVLVCCGTSKGLIMVKICVCQTPFPVTLNSFHNSPVATETVRLPL